MESFHTTVLSSWPTMLKSVDDAEQRFHLYLWTGLALLTGYVAYKWFYNLYLHPLRRFPGPKLAAMSSLYEFWYDVIKDGQYLWQIEKMHDEFGPIVRINPRQLHIRDSHYYSKIYAGGVRKVDKDAAIGQALGLPTSIVATIDHHHHRARRGYLNPYFSKAAVVSMESMIYERIDKLCERLEASSKSLELVILDSIFSALTADIITCRFYGEHHDYLSLPDYKMAVSEAVRGVLFGFHFVRFVPSLVTILRKLPIRVIRLIFPPVAELLTFKEEVKHKILASLDEANEDTRKSVIVSVLLDQNIPKAEREIDRFLDEGTALLLAGTETTSRALSVGMFYLLNDKTHLKKLREELNALPSRPANDYPLSQLESLPYLNGVVNESLRLSFGFAGLSSRLSTQESLQYGSYTIPPGTPVSQSAYFVHTDPEIFPDPHRFNPVRWIEAAKTGFPLSNFLVSFSKGSRACIGNQMATIELYLTIARVVRTFDMDLCGSTVEDVRLHYIRVIGFPKKAKNAINPLGEIMVKVKGRAGLTA